MNLGYDIFQQLDDGDVLWVAEVSSIAEARQRLQVLLLEAPSKYFVRRAATGAVVLRVNPDDAHRA
jgi:hypothetical protein